MKRTALSRREALAVGMALAVHARDAPEQPAIVSVHDERSFDALNRRANQLARALRDASLVAGDGLAVVCANRPEFVETYDAAQRAGLRRTPVNWHLTGEEIAYILEDCEARALVADARFAASLPRLDSGKIQRRKVRDPDWAGRERRI